MKKLFTIALLLCTLCLGGCADKEAREYAKLLAETLRSYQAEINKKIAAEQHSYKALAETHAHARQVETLASLRAERIRRAGALAESLMQNSKLSHSEIQKLVADYAKLDFDSTRAIFEKDGEDQAGFLIGLEALELQSQNLTALVGALEDLAEPKSKITQLKEVGEFAVRLKDRLNELACEDLARNINCLKKALAAAQTDAEKKKIQDEINRLTKAMETDKCDSAALLAKIKCPE